MEKLISDIETYCAARGITPQNLLRIVLNAKWSQWQDWKTGASSPTMKVADRLRAYMDENAACHVVTGGEVSPAVQGAADHRAEKATSAGAAQ